MAKAKSKGKQATTGIDLDLSALNLSGGLVLLRDSDYAKVFDRLPLFLPKIDKIFGGGLPFGRMIEVAGVPSGGKSTFTHHVMRVATALGCICVLIDVEGTSDNERLTALGIDTSKVLVKQPDPDKGTALTVEEVGQTVEETLKLFGEKYPHVPVVYVWDSVGSTPSQVELEKDFGEQNVGARAKAITQFVTKVTPMVSQSKSLFIGINQVRDDIGGNPMFKTYKVPGGKAWEHAATLRIEIKNRGAINKGSGVNKERLGHTMGVKTQKSKVSRPFQEATGSLLADTGIDYEYNLVTMGDEAGIIGKPSNQSYEYVDQFGTVYKQNRASFIEWLRTPEAQPVRQEILNKLIQIEFPDGYTALKNETLDISGWIDQVVPVISPEFSQSSDNSDNIEDLLSKEAEDILKG
ncbi:UvsX-like recombinase [Bacillus phage Bcp1]|uniref:Putative recA-like recombinase n=1 Tax=Bacillus phage Bcp1 TaxID=584892 RepID=C7F8K4_9CAUD|nr:UvsX-like recombinase [Bacillus phage Bcp1]ACU27400.1 recombination repair protein [Bacillus phage Bcp1]AHN66616.1 putative recA-like recombinase [Bacillus phage Bcp1]AXQ67807.1 RecA [Bacillus phage Kioshi]